MIRKYITWVHYLNQNKEVISKLYNLSIKTLALEEYISVADECVAKENSLWLQKGSRG